MLSTIPSNQIVQSLDLDLTPQQKPKLLMILEGLQIIIKNPALFIYLLSEIEQYLLILKKEKPKELEIYIDMIKSENKEDVKNDLKKK